MEGSLWCLKNEMAEAISLPFRFGFSFPVGFLWHSKNLSKGSTCSNFTPPPIEMGAQLGRLQQTSSSGRPELWPPFRIWAKTLQRRSTKCRCTQWIGRIKNPLRTPPSLKGSQSESTISGSPIGLGWPCVACSPKRKGKNDPPKGVQFGRQLHPQIPLVSHSELTRLAFPQLAPPEDGYEKTKCLPLLGVSFSRTPTPQIGGFHAGLPNTARKGKRTLRDRFRSPSPLCSAGKLGV